VPARCLQKDSELVRCPLREFAAAASGPLRPFSRVGREHLVHGHCVPEGLPQDRVYVFSTVRGDRPAPSRPPAVAHQRGDVRLQRRQRNPARAINAHGGDRTHRKAGRTAVLRGFVNAGAGERSMRVPAALEEARAGIDVGKWHHWVCVADRDGRQLLSVKVANDEAEIAAAIGSATRLAGKVTWAVDIVGAPSALLLALPARRVSRSATHRAGSWRQIARPFGRASGCTIVRPVIPASLVLRAGAARPGPTGRR
jgi:Transposase